MRWYVKNKSQAGPDRENLNRGFRSQIYTQAKLKGLNFSLKKGNKIKMNTIIGIQNKKKKQYYLWMKI